ncbi:MAG: hypothetical protein CR980_00410 [Propionibacteriales bacterium]|nr:MAG: hypothetical protein CR980_00410 [Propionibacteriales bacterium]
MTCIVLTNATGSPGVTTTAVGLALAWPRDVCLVEANPHTDLAISAGYLRGAPHAHKGLLGVAEALRTQQAFSVTEHCVQITKDEPVTRYFFPGPTKPSEPTLFAPVWQRVFEAFAETNSLDVIVDAGRVGHRGLGGELAAMADVLLLVLRSSLPSIAGAHLYLPQLRAQAAATDKGLELLLVGQNRPYKVTEVQQQFSLPVTAALPWDETRARAFSEGEPQDRKFEQSSYWKALTATAKRMAAHHE